MTTSVATASGTALVSCAGVPIRDHGSVRSRRSRRHLPASAEFPVSVRAEECSANLSALRWKARATLVSWFLRMQAAMLCAAGLIRIKGRDGDLVVRQRA